MYDDFNKENEKKSNYGGVDYNYQPENKPNKVYQIGWKVILVAIVISLSFLSLIYFDVITFNSSNSNSSVIVLNQSEIGLKTKKTYQLQADIYSSGSKKSKLKYESSDTSVVQVNELTGFITAIKEGTAIITVKNEDTEETTSCVVNVSDDNISVVSINVNNKDIGLAKGSTERINYTVTPNNATDLKLSFQSSDSSVAIVDASGVVEGVSAGVAEIKVVSKTTGAYDTVNVTVYEKNTSTMVEGASVLTKNFPNKISFEKTSIFLSSGSTYQLVPIIKPNEASKDVAYISQDPTIAKVDSNGLITAVDLGVTKIIAKTVNDLVAIVIVEVGTDVVSLEGIKINSEINSIILGTKNQLTVTYNPSNATDKGVKWSSSDPEIISVSEDGYIKGLSLGKATITATSIVGNFDSNLELEVVEVGEVIEEESLTFDKDLYEVNINETITLKPIIKPSNVTYKEVEFKSNDSNVATVSENGLVRGISEGEAIITATSYNGLETCIKIKVNKVSATGLAIDSKSVTIARGTSYSLNYNVLPNNATNKEVKYVSSNPSIVIIETDSSGKGIITITGLKVGKTKITITSVDGGYKAICEVKVTKNEAVNVKKIKFSEDMYTVPVKGTLKVMTEIIPNNAIDQNVVYTSKNPNIATIDKNGVVTGLKTGVATIIATCGGKTTTTKVKVVEVSVEKITLSNTEIQLAKGEKFSLAYEITPNNATVKKIIWSSSDSKIVTVDEGVVKGISKGVATITAKTIDGGHIATCKITVGDKTYVPIKSVSFVKGERVVMIDETLQLKVRYQPSDATNVNFTYSSDNEKIATVNQDGLVKGVSAGKTKIIVKSVNGKKSSVEITVKTPTVTGISLPTKDSVALETKSKNLEVKITPSNADPKLIWSSSNTKVATVDKNGKITPKKIGLTTITVKVADTDIVASCLFEVTGEVLVDVEKITFKGDTPQQMQVGATYNLKNNIEILPIESSNRNIKYSDYSKKIISIDDNGIVKALKSGETNVVVTVGKKSLKVKFKILDLPINSFYLSEAKNGLVLPVLGTATLTPVINEVKTTNSNIKWSSSHPEIVSVTDDGKIKVKKKSTKSPIITATLNDHNGKKLVSTVKITISDGAVVKPSNLKLKLKDSNNAIYVGDYVYIIAEINEEATDKSVLAVSETQKKAEIVEVVKNSDNTNSIKVRILDNGKIKIKVSANANSKLSKTITFEAKNKPAESVTLNHSNLTIEEGKTATLIATIKPDNTTNKAIDWKSKNSKIVSVDNKGNIKAKGVGTTKIIVTTSNNKTAECTITVIKSSLNPITKIEFNKKEINIKIGETYVLNPNIKPSDTKELVAYSLASEGIVKLSGNKIEALKKGSVNVIAKSPSDSSIKDILKVVVEPSDLTGIKLDNQPKNLTIGDKIDLVLSPNPSTAKLGKNIKWTSSNNNVVKINDNNNKATLIAKGLGTSSITVKSGAFSINWNISVNPVSQEQLTGVEFISSLPLNKNGLLAVNKSGNKYSSSNILREYRYSGNSTDVTSNYIKFNNEIWRIIGVFDVDVIGDASVNNKDKTKKCIKIIRQDSLANSYHWNNVDSNNWTTSTLMQYLNNKNTGYLSTINSDSSRYIQPVTYYLGNVDVTSTASEIYDKERNKSRVSTGNKATWYGSIGLMYASDYGYAANSNYWAKNLSRYSDAAYLYNWLYNNSAEWLLSSISEGKIATKKYAGYINTHGSLYYDYTSAKYSIRPTLYLKPSTKLKGSGTIDNPYIPYN